MSISRIKEILVKNKDPKIYTPKFKVGDFIINAKYNIVSRVVELLDTRQESETLYKRMRIPFDYNAQINCVHYTLEDISNPNRNQKYLRRPRASKVAVKIDSYYKLINEKTARILYGNK